MRERKFRALYFDRELGKNVMIYGTLCDFIMWLDEQREEWVDYIEGNGLEGISEYTGLKDKNGKEIYEGDILQFVDRGGDTYGRTFLMKWVEEQGAWTFYFPKKDAIVIGNIYENPELLDEE